VSEEYDDNVRLSSTNPESDFVTAIRPRLRLELLDESWAVTLAGSTRSEFFARRTELNNTADNLEGNADIQYRARRFTLSLTDTFVRSVNPGDVDPQTGLILERAVSTTNTIGPGLSYQLDPLTALRTQYSYRTLSSDSPLARDSTTHDASVALQRQLTPTFSGNVSYAFTRFQIEGSPDRDSHSPRLGLTTTYLPNVRISSNTGLLFVERPDGTTEMTFASTTRYDQTFRLGDLSLAYDRNAGVGGVLGVSTVTQSVTLAGTVQATRDLTLGLNAGITDTSADAVGGPQAPSQEIDLRVYNVTLRATYRLLRWLSIEGSYRYQRQEDRVGTRDLQRNVFFLGLTVSDLFRLY
jgi:hypothetical protein